MRITHETYRRATRAAIIGAIFHFALTAIMFALAFGLGDSATKVLAYAMAAGLPVWAALILVFHQSALEQLEALEHRQLSERADQTGAIFDFSEGDDRRHAARLRWMHRFMLPAVSLLVAGLYLIIGWWQRIAIQGGLADISKVGEGGPIAIASETGAGWGAAVTSAIALVSFVVSWYLGGMSRQAPWRLLRAGATVIISAAVGSAALAIAFGFQVNESPTLLTALAHILPIYVMVLGGEIVVSFIINLYTPRKAGDYPTPAFDSRILGLLAAPESVIKSINDAINYQFGFSVTSTWFYQLIVRQLLPLAGFVTAVLILLNCIAIVQPNEQAIVTSFGAIKRGETIYDSGPVLKFPWERVERIPVSQLHEVVVGIDSLRDDNKPILWTTEHSVGDEELIIVGPSSKGQSTEIEGAPAAARSIALLNAEVPVQYRIKTGMHDGGESHLLDYLRFAGPDEEARTLLIRQIATRTVHRYLGTLTIDAILGPARSRLSKELGDLIQSELDARDAGIEVVFVGIAGVHPPTDVAATFEAVLTSAEQREAMIESARAQAINRLSATAGSEAQARSLAQRIQAVYDQGISEESQAAEIVSIEQALLQSGGSAGAQILRARADRWETHNNQLATTIRHASRMAPFLAASRYYQYREYLDTLARALDGKDLVIVPPGIDIRATIDLQYDPTLLNPTNIGATMRDAPSIP